MRTRIAIAVLSLVVLASSPGLTARRLRLRYDRLRDPRTFQIAILTTIRQEVAGCPVERAERLMLSGVFQPESGGAGRRVRVELTGIQGSLSTPFEERSFDTRSGASGADPLVRRYDYAGSHLVLDFSPAGPDYSASLSFVKSQAKPRIGAENQAGSILTILSGLERNDSLQSMLLAQAVVGILPEYARGTVKQGESWITKARFSNGTFLVAGPMDWRANAGGAGCRLTAQGTMNFNISREANILGRRTAHRVEGSGGLRGEAEVSRRGGWPARGMYRLELAGRSTGNGLETPVSILIEIYFELSGR